MKTFGDLAVDPDNVQAVAALRRSSGLGAIGGLTNVGQVILKSGERLNVSSESSQKLIAYFKDKEVGQ